MIGMNIDQDKIYWLEGNLKNHKEHGNKLTAPHVSIKVGIKEVTRTLMRQLLKYSEFDDNTEITIKDLLDRGLIKGRFDGVKILGNGNLTSKIDLEADYFSISAKEKIEKLGGVLKIKNPKLKWVSHHKPTI